MNKIDRINELLKDIPDLKCEHVYKRGIDFIENILRIPEWKEPQFQSLLTSNIWQSNAQEI